LFFLREFDFVFETPAIPSPALGGLFRFFEGVGFGEVADVAEAEDFEEVAGGAVEHGSADFFGAADDFDEVVFHEGAEHFAAGDAADDFDAGAGDGLFVGDDGEGFEGGG